MEEAPMPSSVKLGRRIVSEAIRSVQRDPEHHLSQRQEKDLREAYLAIVTNRAEGDVRADMIAMCQGVGSDLDEASGGGAAPEPARLSEDALSFTVNGEAHECRGASVLFGGRLQWCDILLSADDPTVSRINFIVFRLGEMLVVIDSWSMHGTHVLDRGGGGGVVGSAPPMSSSVPGRRRPLLFGRQEAFSLLVGDSFPKTRGGRILCFIKLKNVYWRNCIYEQCYNMSVQCAACDLKRTFFDDACV